MQKHPRRRSSFPWRGLTLFVRPQEVKPKACEKGAFVQRDGVTYKFPWPEGRGKFWSSFVAHEKRVRKACEVYLLRMKASGKELDPRFFDKEEEQAFHKSDVAEWESWIKNKVVEIVPPERAKNIPRNKIFRIPLRWVRVNKGKELGKAAKLLAKSRLVVPGHADPHLGDYRTDAPTTSPSSVSLLKVLSVTRGWITYVFDVSTAFLAGNPTEREVYARAPGSGLPETSLSKKIAPFSLLRILKSAYGLAEAPRLWYLRASQLLEECGLQELPFARATFVKSVGEQSVAVCTLHVDDGMLAGPASSPEFQKILSEVNKKFNIKEWKVVGPNPVDFLGCKVSLCNGMIKDCMKTYVQKIDPMEIPTPKEVPLTDKQRTAYRRLIMQLRWPAQHVLPERLFAVSELAQKVTVATTTHARQANKLLLEFKQLSNDGLMELCYRPLKGDPVMISFFDASLGKSGAARAQQGQVHFVSSSAAMDTLENANIISFRSAKITRVVKSSLSAEGNSLSSAADEQLYLRLLCEAMWFKVPTISSSWKESLDVDGIVVTDAKALFDHVMKTGHMTAEKQTMLDILAAKQLVESACLRVAWVPTFRQFADGLTKDMVDELFREFKRKGKISLKETPEDQKIEEHRAGLRKAQRERRKLRMKASISTPSSSNVMNKGNKV